MKMLEFWTPSVELNLIMLLDEYHLLLAKPMPVYETTLSCHHRGQSTIQFRTGPPMGSEQVLALNFPMAGYSVPDSEYSRCARSRRDRLVRT
jgi:hypothetical protein